MTTRERWLAAMKMEPVDRLPVWPKLLNKNYVRHHSTRLPNTDMSLEELNSYFGSDELVRLPDFTKTMRKNTATSVVEEAENRITTYTTPIGSTRLVHRIDKSTDSIHPVEFPIAGRDDLRTMTCHFQDAVPQLDEKALEKAIAIVDERGGTASTMSWVGKSPLMQLVENLAGVEQAHYLLADHPREVEALFDAMHYFNVEKTKIMAKHSPADAIYFIENTSTTLISPTQFQAYCVKHLEEYGNIIRDEGKIYALHMCGHLKALLPGLANSSASVFESFTSPTLGNTRFIDGRTVCPDTCLVGGTNAMVWTEPAPIIINYLKSELDTLPHHRGIAVTSAGVLPPHCRPDVVRAVCDWVKEYPVRN